MFGGGLRLDQVFCAAQRYSYGQYSDGSIKCSALLNDIVMANIVMAPSSVLRCSMARCRIYIAGGMPSVWARFFEPPR